MAAHLFRPFHRNGAFLIAKTTTFPATMLAGYLNIFWFFTSHQRIYRERKLNNRSNDFEKKNNERA
jgi:hypothetical protein